MAIRKAVYAGSWYPGDRDECEKQIRAFLAESRFTYDRGGRYVAGIVPHAGWFFSGDLACTVIGALRGDNDEPAPDVVVIFGMHLPPNVPPFITAEGQWGTPLGNIDIASDLAEKLTARHRFRIETPEKFTPDNTIELQMPFVKYFFDDARILTIGPPPGPAAVEIARTVIDGARELGLSIKIIGSSDLTHYGPNFGFTPAGSGRPAYEWVRDTNDRRVIDRMLAMDPDGVITEGLSHHSACCPGAAAAAIVAATALGARKAELAGYSSSYEKNPGNSFVGYTGVLFRA